jgi:ribulose kinase
VRRAISEGNIDPERVRGIGFDATCSLAVFNTETNEPVSISPGFNTDRNVILWLDHRAVRETDEIINATGHKVLRYTGGKMSPEMEIPKILWLKKNMPADVFAECKFYDLVDALTHIATGGGETRSLCSLVCKQAYLPKGVEGSTQGWQRDFLEEIGLGDLAARGFEQIGGVDGEVSRWSTLLRDDQAADFDYSRQANISTLEISQVYSVRKPQSSSVCRPESPSGAVLLMHTPAG